METPTFDYKPKPLVMLLGVLFFGASGAFAIHQALTNEQELLINGVLHLTVGQATAFFWTLGLASAGFVALGLWGIYNGLTSKAVLTLGPDALTMPGGPFKPPRTIPYGEIEGLYLVQINRQVMLTMLHAGKRPTIAGSLLKNKAAFETVCREVSARSGKPIA